MITESTIRSLIESLDAGRDDGPQIIANGVLVVLQYQDRLFVYSRWTHHAFELLPDFESSITVNRL